MSAPVSSPRSLANAQRCRPRSRPAQRDPSAAARCLHRPGRGRRAAAAKRGERVVELLPRHGLRAPAVAQQVDRLACEVERVGDAGQPPRGLWARTVHSRQALASAIRWPARFPLSTVET